MRSSVKSFFKRKTIRKILLALLFFISMFAILSTSLKPEKFDLVIGQSAPVDIYSPKDIEDRYYTELLRQEAIEKVEPVYILNPGVHVEVKKDVQSFFSLAYKIKNDEELTKEEKIKKLEIENDLAIKGENLETVVIAPSEDLTYLESYINEIISQNMNTGIEIDSLQKQKNNIKEYISNLEEFETNLKELAISIVNSTIRPNKFIDENATNEKIQMAEESVERVIINKGDSILKEGERITSHRLELLSELGVLTDDDKIDFSLYIGIASIILVIELLIIGYMSVFNKDLLSNPSKLFMIYIIFTSTLIIAKVIAGISIYLIPVATCAMLLSILVDSRLALLINLCLTVLISIITGNNIAFIAMALIGGTVGAFSSINTQQRSNIFITGLVVSLFNASAIVGIRFINSSEVMQTITFVFYGGLNGLLCSIVTVGSLPLWESVFKIVTPLKLLELSNPNRPLLKKLLLEAPGTYHHSIIVGNLSESAVDAIGGNSLLARVGAFYHDIGKTSRPYFFKENQLSSDNPHDKLTPNLSAHIILEHVKYGVELAKKHKLPYEISDFITEHHGDTLVAYFYHKAKNSESGDIVEEANFRYEGPKPKTKETAVVMMADSVEAAVRSISSPTKEKIDEVIEKIIQSKLNDGQLEECDITLKELSEIKRVFSKVILSIFHERIEYPNMDVNTEEEEKSDGAIN